VEWYLKRNTSCDAHLLNELLETDVPWDNAIVVSAGKLRQLWDALCELRSSLCERRLEKTLLRPALLPVKSARFTQFFRQVWRHTVKSLSWIDSVQRPLQMRTNPPALLGQRAWLGAQHSWCERWEKQMWPLPVHKTWWVTRPTHSLV